MTEKLLRKRDIAAMLGTTPGVAASILEARGIHPIDFGYGRSRGPRWLESAVLAAIQTMHKEAQPQPRQPKLRLGKKPEISLASATVAEVYALTSCQNVQ